ncbi:MAG: Cell shape-determining protein MreC [Chlamydiae bacterium]|nr:Cell shape-determining protein MreC [Chlamydiota bacterium]
MKKIKKRPWLLIALTLVLLLSVSASTSQKFQSVMVGMLSPLWKKIQYQQDQSIAQKIESLELENTLLKSKLEEIKALFIWEHELQVTATEMIAQTGLTLETVENLERNQKEAYTLFDLELCSCPAKVIYRSPTSWNSTLWINVGENENKKLGRPVIAKNSPVVVGDSIVGVVELVKEHKSRIRLITDPELTPSVRALREVEGQTLYLAKGEVHGSANVLWRSRGHLLIGEGFNYDYEDKYGPERELRSDMPILKAGDLLVTTGMDGVFPKGLKVGIVTKIQMLREGDYYYEIEAVPTVENVEELSFVTVLPPLNPGDF